MCKGRCAAGGGISRLAVHMLRILDLPDRADQPANGAASGGPGSGPGQGARVGPAGPAAVTHWHEACIFLAKSTKVRGSRRPETTTPAMGGRLVAVDVRVARRCLRRSRRHTSANGPDLAHYSFPSGAILYNGQIFVVGHNSFPAIVFAANSLKVRILVSAAPGMRHFVVYPIAAVQVQATMRAFASVP